MQGTYLPYRRTLKRLSPHGMRFRPLAGDLSSLRTGTDTRLISMMVSVPLQGTYLPYNASMMRYFGMIGVSVPLQGTYLPYVNVGTTTMHFLSFRPLAGDLSSLRKSGGSKTKSKSPFPSPCRGLIFLTKAFDAFSYDAPRFRPLAGDLSSLHKSPWRLKSI